MKKITVIIFLLTSIVFVSGCSRNSGSYSGDAEKFTVKYNEDFNRFNKLDDPVLKEESARGFIAAPEGKITGPSGEVLVDFSAFKFLEGNAPETVNPSLWYHAVLNAKAGLFKVTDGIYQLRGFDIANMTLIEGKTGWIIVDPLTSRESASAAIAFARKHLGNKKVSAVIFTHSHIDHFGGIFGVISAREADTGKLPVIAPDGFMEEAISENIMVGTAMVRRSTYQFGKDLERSPKGMLDTGLGKSVAYGSAGIIKPNRIIKQSREDIAVDGVRFIFFNVPFSEAPAEFTFLIPDKKAYCGAEILAQTIHNLLPVRGAKVRDSLRWSGYLDQALEHTSDSEVIFLTHNWPVWGKRRISEFIAKHRDVYKYTHDQTVRLINAGYTAREIADKVKLPPSLQSYLGSRGYYGDIRHNVKAVYQFYMGFYDGNPANLNPLPPEESAKRYIDLMGGADKTIAAAKSSYEKGDYRWAAELLNHVVFADPGNKNAVSLLARTYDQMAYISESSAWRNSYLTAAAEIRNGPPKKGLDRTYMTDIIRQTPVERFLDAMAASLNGPDAEGKKYKINLIISDKNESFVLWIENAVLHYRKSSPAPDADATLTVTKELFIKMILGNAGVKDILLSDDFKINGSRLDLIRFFSLIDKAPGTFGIVTP